MNLKPFEQQAWPNSETQKVSAAKFDTCLLHGGTGHSKPGAGVAPGIEFSTTFERTDPRDDQPFTYSRSNNPNRRNLEQRIASLEDAFDAVAFASGSAATLALCQALPANSHILVTADAYWGTISLLNDLVAAMGHQVTAVDTTEINNLQTHWQTNTRLIWLETPSNPQMRISDIALIGELAHQHDALLCCDNTLATSVFQQPMTHGADFSMHSSTKFFGGHSDVTGGVLLAKTDSKIFQRVRQIQALSGAVPSPFDCWLLQRSIATLGVRVRHQSASASIIAQFLAQHAQVERVLYAGHHDHPQAELIQRQMHGGGAILSLLVSGGRQRALQVAKNTSIIKQATSLGGVESLIEHRYSVEGEHSMSPENLLRLSIGLEDKDDLIADLDQALTL